MTERDEPPTTGEAETAGTAQVVTTPGGGFAVLGEGLCLAEGDLPVAMLIDRSTALLVAAALPASARAPAYRLGKEADGHGFPLYEHGRRGGHLTWFDEGLVAGLNHLGGLLRTPASLAQLLEAGGGLVLERVGRLLERRTRQRPPDAGQPSSAADHGLFEAWLDGVEAADRRVLWHLASCGVCQSLVRARFAAEGRPPRRKHRGRRRRPSRPATTRS